MSDVRREYVEPNLILHPVDAATPERHGLYPGWGSLERERGIMSLYPSVSLLLALLLLALLLRLAPAL